MSHYQTPVPLAMVNDPVKLKYRRRLLTLGNYKMNNVKKTDLKKYIPEPNDWLFLAMFWQLLE
jgi:hypothetical protein